MPMQGSPELREFEPISPDEAVIKRVHDVPFFVVKVINNFLSREWDGYRAKVTHNELRKAILEAKSNPDFNPGGTCAFVQITEQDIINRKWLSEDTLNALYGPKGWKVSADYPDYTETYDSFLLFKKK